MNHANNICTIISPCLFLTDDDDEPFKKLLSELNNDIGEISESSKRNAGRSSGVQPKGPVLTTQSTTITNSSIKPISTQRPIPVSTGVKPNLQTPTPLPNVNKNKTQEKIVEAKQQKPSGNNHHTNKEKMADKANGTVLKNIQKNTRKMNRPKQVQKKTKKQQKGIFSQLSCSKIKTSPTCVQIYHECINERKIEVDRCNRLNSTRKKKVQRRKKLLTKTKTSKGKMKLPQKPPLRTPNQNPSRTVANTHPKKSGNQNKHPTNQTGQNAKNNSSPTKSANSKTQKNQISKGNGRKPIDKQSEKKMVVGEIRGLLAYLKRMKDHLSRPINNNNAVKGENKNGN